ncbi:MAG: hypothetical protein DHS20C15_26410 [Planctomycetota bacterium]|nr:MAG: hypothetical protein DHS20C15_26410 [Planctomycetota bacterium]
MSSTPLPSILIVDDDADIRRALGIRLGAMGYEPLFASDGTDALAMLATHEPKLVLLDLGLPNGDGYFVLERLHELPSMSHIPVIVFSGWEIETHATRARELGASDFVQKPLSAGDLEDLLERWIPDASSSTSSADADMPATAPFDGLSVLLVDDDADLLRSLNVRMRSLGFRTYVARDGLNATRLIRHLQPDLVLLDLGLPAGNGLKVLERIEALGLEHDVPVIVMTGWVGTVADQAYDFGAREVLTKPVDESDLRRTIHRVLEKV